MTQVHSAADAFFESVRRLELAEFVFGVTGFANVFLVRTSEGNVLVDAGYVAHPDDADPEALQQKRLLDDVAPGPVSHVILTHAHRDHVGGLYLWRQPDTEVLTHRRFLYRQTVDRALEPFRHRRIRSLYPQLDSRPHPMTRENSFGRITPTQLVAEDHPICFERGERLFEVLATPGGEGDDGISLWLPNERMLFSGDLFSVAIPSWPNLFPLRGTRFRDPLPMLDTIESLIALEPEWVFPGHFEPMRGCDRIREAFLRERDAIRYVVDSVIAGLNEGLDVYEMMKVELPAHLDVPQIHGKVSWSVRGLAEALGGWFHHDSTAVLYPVSPRAVSPALVELAGGIEAFLERAQRFVDAKQPIHALHLVEIAAGASPDDARLRAMASEIYRALLSDATNYNERAWLEGRLALMESTSDAAPV